MTSIDPSQITGQGALAPRARFTTSAPSVVLDGEWAFRYTATSAGVAAPDDLAGTLDTASWDRIPVPSSWPMHGDGRYGLPAYTNTRFPWPIDPPHVPDENAVGDYATTFTWIPTGRTLLRLDGVDAAGDVVLNGTPVGTTRGSRIVHEFDVTDAVRDGENTLVVRVTQWAATSYLEDQDMWWLPGLFRSVTVLARPDQGIRDVRVAADWVEGAGRLRVEVDSAAPGDAVSVRIPELGIDAVPGEEVVVRGVAPWTAESPRLYDLVVATPTETARLKVGFRTVSIEDGVLLVNGSPVTLRGVNRHEHHPDLGRVVPRDVVEHELRLMKRHNVNAIRTSHYPPHPELVDLADELGFWLILECDLETHGFVHVDWRGNPSDDPAWLPAFLDRMARTVERDRNHPSVIIWSLGNESGTGRNLEAMAAEARRRDPSRPIHYEGDGDSGYVDLYSRMYPTHAEVAEIARFDEPVTADPALDAHRRGLPFVFCEYAHAMGTGPGGMSEYQELIEQSPRIAGAFAWEWLEHGIRRHTPDGREYWAYGGDFGERVHDANFVADGLVDADRRPRPQLADFARVIAPVSMLVDGAELVIRNRYDTLDTSHLAFAWSRGCAEDTDSGLLEVPPIPPHGEGRVTLPSRAAGILTVRAVLSEATPWAPAGHEIAWVQDGEVAAARPLGRRAGVVRDGEHVRLGPVELDARSGRVVAIAGTAVSGPELALWRAPTDNDLRRPFDEGMADADDWRASGLDDLRSRLVELSVTEDSVTVVTRVAPPSFDRGARLTTEWTTDGSRTAMAVSIEPEGDWPGTWARAGVTFRVPAADGVEWVGLGPHQVYPDTGQGARSGRWSETLDGLRTDYVRPQENGSRARVDDLELRRSGGGIGIEPGGASFTLSRWSVAQLAAAAHPVELSDPDGGAWLTIDFAQHGIGTAACGPGVLPQYRLTPRTITGTVVFRGL